MPVNLRFFMSMNYNFVFHTRIFTVNEYFFTKVFIKDKKNSSLIQQYLLKFFNLMKLPVTTISFILLTTTLQGQLIPVKNSFQSDLAKVISDYPAHFKNLAGESIMDNPQTTEYGCRQSVKDAISCRVSKYSSSVKEIFSWQAVMMSTESFEEAAKKFHSLYSAIQNLSVKINGETVVMKGKYIQPAEEMKFTSVVFDAGEKDPSLKNLKVELLLDTEMLDWVVRVLVYEKEREDNERGKTDDK
jgi:hypothetical protein